MAVLKRMVLKKYEHRCWLNIKWLKVYWLKQTSYSLSEHTKLLKYPVEKKILLLTESTVERHLQND